MLQYHTLPVGSTRTWSDSESLFTARTRTNRIHLSFSSPPSFASQAPFTTRHENTRQADTAQIPPQAKAACVRFKSPRLMAESDRKTSRNSETGGLPPVFKGCIMKSCLVEWMLTPFLPLWTAGGQKMSWKFLKKIYFLSWSRWKWTELLNYWHTLSAFRNVALRRLFICDAVCKSPVLWLVVAADVGTLKLLNQDPDNVDELDEVNLKQWQEPGFYDTRQTKTTQAHLE